MSRSRQARRAGVLALAALALGATGGCGSDGSGNGTTTTKPPGSTQSSAQDPSPPTAGAPEGPAGPERPRPAAAKPANPVGGLPPKVQIDYAIKGVLASGLAALACDEAATKNFVETTFGDRGGCMKATVPASAASSVAVTAINIHGSKATATAKPTGGPSDGETIKVRLLHTDGAWKVDSLRSNAPVGP